MMQTPDCTYRIQLHAGFTFRDLEEILDYLHELGISTIYASPITQSVKGSMHGYDATDPLTVNREIGSEEDLQRLAGLLKKYNMSWVQDIVPNHMAYADSNAWLFDVLEKGEDSEFYRFFDIDWDHSDPELNGRLMAPFLGENLEACLQKGEIRLEFKGKGFNFRYYDSQYPVNVDAHSWIKEAWSGCPPEWPETGLTPGQASDAVAFFNERSQLLRELLDLQHYALTHHRLSEIKIDYRRFFTVNSLICLRMEDERVFSAFHRSIHSWYEKGYIQGLRIDHIDGLADPAGYTRRLKELFGRDCYIVAEKILQADESLPVDWQLEGTTGYEFLFLVNQLMTEQEGSRKIVEFYRKLVPSTPRYEDIQFTKKYEFLKKHMGGELDNLVDRLIRTGLLSDEDVRGAGHAGREQLREALAMMMASFPVYRVYPDAGPLPDASRLIVEAAFARARQKSPSLEKTLNSLQEIVEGTGNEERNRQALPFRIRLMQFTGPLAAKGIEDTTFYTYDPLLSHNEVGDTPGINGIGIEEFHQKMLQRQATLPLSMNTTATHDTKRGEDARMRLNLLSAIPEEWIAAVTRWRAINRSLLNPVHGHDAPTPNDEYFIYQSLLGAIPVELVITDGFRERFRQFLVKALREARTETNWEEPDEPYEKSCVAFVNALLAHDSAFLKDFLPFAGRIIQKAATYSLSQLLIKLTAPGIPDIYQGTELLDLSFVDPDNRRPVNYDHRKYLLKGLEEAERKGIPALLTFLGANKGSGVEKLFVLQRTLAYRKAHPLVFTQGEYLPLRTDPHWIAYLRRHEKDWLLVIVPLIRKEWNNVKSIGILSLDLPAQAPTQWKNEFTGQGFRETTMPMTAEIFAGFPVTLLSGTGPMA
jgi:(1->4)-alpha-D-glucan 1-alpha-D-glucosylmutase